MVDRSEWTMPTASAMTRAGYTQFAPPTHIPGGSAFRREPARKLIVLVSVDDYGAAGAGVWAHASVSRSDRDPTWNEIKHARDAVFGPEAVVMQILAPSSRWLNVHAHCYHLHMRLDAETMPRALWDQHGADGSRYSTGGAR